MPSVTEEYVWFITGANRGIGLELIKQLLQNPSNIIVAGCRNPAKATALHALSDGVGGKLRLVPIDVTDPGSVRAAAALVSQLVGDKGIDYLINNAGVNPSGLEGAFDLDFDAMAFVYLTNAIGPACVSQEFLPLVERSVKRTIVNISSTLGSVGARHTEVYSSYSMTKAALNMLTCRQAQARPDITSICICPGWLPTDLGGPDAETPVPVGVSGIIKVIGTLGPKDSGSFFNYRGERPPW